MKKKRNWLINIFLFLLLLVGLALIFNNQIKYFLMQYNGERYAVPKMDRNEIDKNMEKEASFDFDAVEPASPEAVLQAQLSNKRLPVIGGIATFYGMPVTVIGQEKGKTTKDNLKCNFGMPSPEGYRKALRLMKQAEKFNRPVICFVDTPGAFCGLEAEERGQGEAIARNLFEMSDLKVPILTIVIGEGGSGGALALAVANEVWMMENSVYSVLSPEGFASILWKDSKRASEAAKVMKMTAKDLYGRGLIERIIADDLPATAETAEIVGEIIDRHMREFFKTGEIMTPEEIVSQRYDRFRGF